MDTVLCEEEVRVLGCLIEKEMATPEYYPLTLNALLNACNQKTNRDPVVAYDEDIVLRALDGLKEKQAARQVNLGRVPKFEERFVEESNFNRQEAAVMATLMLRGPQTAGEIRIRSERLYAFGSLGEVQDTLESLASVDRIMRMPRRPGQKEVRFGHLMAGVPEDRKGETLPLHDQTAVNPAAHEDRLAVLEKKVERLSMETAALKEAFSEFKKQFE